MRRIAPGVAWVLCRTCDGKGRLGSAVCKACGGEGWVRLS